MNKTDTMFAPGKLVKGILSGMIVMCVDTPKDYSNNFAGVVIYQGESPDYPVGHYSYLRGSTNETIYLQRV